MNKNDKKDTVVFDIEIYANYFLAYFKNYENKKEMYFELFDNEVLSDENIQKILKIFRYKNVVGYNTSNFDIPILKYALSKKMPFEIKKMSNDIIKNGLYFWESEKKYGINNLYNYLTNNCIDLIRLSSNIIVSLKLLGARLHSKKLQDLPYEHDKNLKKNEMDNVREYCKNDLDLTYNVFLDVKNKIDLRKKINKTFEKNIISKSDAQICELFFRQKGITKNDVKIDSFSVDIPENIKFISNELNEFVDYLRITRFNVDQKTGRPKPTEKFKEKIIKIGNTEYKFGAGGIHSKEKSVSYYSNNSHTVIDKDVTSYYPSIILNNKIHPDHIGAKFLGFYKEVVDRRIKAKKEGNDLENAMFKIIINSSFGKFGDKYSVLYSPKFLYTVTIIGQLSLLILIERLEKNEISVVSANTDGFVSIVKNFQKGDYDDICENWENEFKYNLEQTIYESIHIRDVNNYIAKTVNDIKRKGIFVKSNINKNPSCEICTHAIERFLFENESIESTIKNCDDITKFFLVRNVKGGALFRGKYLGRVARWVYSKEKYSTSCIEYNTNGNKVPKSDNAYVVMNIDDEKNIFEKIDYDRYIDESVSILNEIGINIKNKENKNVFETN